MLTKNIADSLANSADIFSNVISFEIYAKETKKQIRITAFPQVFIRLEAFVVGNSNVTFLADSAMVKFIKSLKRFHLTINSGQSPQSVHYKYLRELTSYSECRRLKLFSDVGWVAGATIKQKKPSIKMYQVDETIQLSMDTFWNVQKLKSIQIKSEPSLAELKNIEMLRISDFTCLEELDLSRIHVHSNKSICKLIGDLKCKMEISFLQHFLNELKP